MHLLNDVLPAATSCASAADAAADDAITTSALSVSLFIVCASWFRRLALRQFVCMGLAVDKRPVGDFLFRALERRQIFNDRTDILRGYPGLIVVDHLADFRCPGLLRQRWLVQYHPGRVTGEAVVVDRVRTRTAGEHLVAVRQIDLDRLQFQGCSGASG